MEAWTWHACWHELKNFRTFRPTEILTFSCVTAPTIIFIKYGTHKVGDLEIGDLGRPTKSGEGYRTKPRQKLHTNQQLSTDTHIVLPTVKLYFFH